MSRSRGFVFTINHWTNEDMSDIILMSDLSRYIIVGFEIGEQGVPHMQGYVYFDEAKTYRTVSKYINRAHLEIAKASGSKAYKRSDYCRKDGDYWEFGVEPTPGKIGKDYLIQIIESPYENIHAYNQYNKMYRMLQNQERKEIHECELNFIPETNKYNYSGAFLDNDIDTYDNEDIMVMPSYTSFNILSWLKGFPPRIRRGYEIIIINPRVLYLTYSDVKEYNYLMKHYSDYVNNGDFIII